MPNVCAFTSILDEDCVWIDQYLKEVDRLGMPFAVHFDRCSADTKRKLRHAHRVGWTSQDDPDVEFDETHKQAVFDLVVRKGFDWALAWDVDEVFEKGAVDRCRQLCSLTNYDQMTVRWLNLWENDHHVRVDGPFSVVDRVKWYNLRSQRWKFNHVVINGARAVDEWGIPYEVPGRPSRREMRLYNSELVMLHHGLKTEALRLQHKDRWDRIYGRVGGNPYKIWQYAVNEKEYPPVVESHDYL